jgi:hypothetical protein
VAFQISAFRVTAALGRAFFRVSYWSQLMSDEKKPDAKPEVDRFK